MASDQINHRAEHTWGDTVRVRLGARISMRPGALAEIVGIRTVETAEQAAEFGASMDSKLYLVEFGDGEATEIPEKWIESVSKSINQR